VGVRFVACAVLAACSSGKPRAVEDAKRPAAAGSDAVQADAAPVAVAPSATTGDVQIRVEWPAVPAAVRASPGTTPCGTPRLAQVAPSTTFGIGDVLVIVDGAPAAIGEARVRLADCAWSPRVTVGSSLVIESAADRPAKVVVSSRLRAADLTVKAEEATPPVPVLLPIAGHAVSTSLDAGAVYQLQTEGKDAEVAWVVAAAGAITDASGVVLVKDVPAGVHAVRAWLPPRAGQPARHATGKVTVVAGDLAELTLSLSP
jgi:hypothetical protein